MDARLRGHDVWLLYCQTRIVIPAKARTPSQAHPSASQDDTERQPMFTITKQFAFSASHQLNGLEEDHPCARLHGHNYIVEVELKGAALDQRGFVRDYRELGPLKRLIDDEFDHRHLNEVLGHDHPTAERLALFFYEWAHDRWPEVSAVRVSETPKTWAEYRP